MCDYKYTYSNSDILLNVFWPFSPQLGALISIDKFLFVLWIHFSHVFSMGFKSGQAVQNLGSSLIDPYIYFMCVWMIQLHPRPNLLLMILGFSEEFGDNAPSSLFHPFLQSSRSTGISAPAPSLTVGLEFLGLKASPSLL